MAANNGSVPSGRMRATTAYIIEALALLAVLVASMAVFTQLFAASTQTAASSSRLCRAVSVAENAAEEFSANPAAVEGGESTGLGIANGTSDGFTVKTKVTKDKREAGTLWHAHITVSDDAGKAYELDTQRNVSEAR